MYVGDNNIERLSCYLVICIKEFVLFILVKLMNLRKVWKLKICKLCLEIEIFIVVKCRERKVESSCILVEDWFNYIILYVVLCKVKYN